MAWPIDRLKLNRVRTLMEEQGLTALVVRAPDNIVYLTNYWPMKGYDAVVFPRQGEATLIVIEPQWAEAQRNSWTKDIRLFKSYHPSDPRPPQYRALDQALQVLKERSLTDKVGIELNMGTQAADRMVGEPTTPTPCTALSYIPPTSLSFMPGRMRSRVCSRARAASSLARRMRSISCGVLMPRA